MADELASFIVKADPGTVLFKENDAGDSMFFIHSGKVRIEKEMGGKPEVLAILEKGDFFGEMAVIDQTPRAASAIVEEKAELLKIDTANFEKLLKANIEIAVRMIRKYTARLREANEKLSTLVHDKKIIDEGIADILESAKRPPKLDRNTASVKVLAELVGKNKESPIPLLSCPATIGRIDPATNISPDIDLTEMDTGRSVSRRHAKLFSEKGQFFLSEEVGVANGTYVNGKKLVPGSPALLEDGAKIKFGNVEFVFQLP